MLDNLGERNGCKVLTNNFRILDDSILLNSDNIFSVTYVNDMLFPNELVDLLSMKLLEL